MARFTDRHGDDDASATYWDNERKATSDPTYPEPGDADLVLDEMWRAHYLATDPLARALYPDESAAARAAFAAEVRQAFQVAA